MHYGQLTTTHTHTHTHTQPFYGPLGSCPGLPRWAGTNYQMEAIEVAV